MEVVPCTLQDIGRAQRNKDVPMSMSHVHVHRLWSACRRFREFTVVLSPLPPVYSRPYPQIRSMRRGYFLVVYGIVVTCCVARENVWREGGFEIKP